MKVVPCVELQPYLGFTCAMSAIFLKKRVTLFPLSTFCPFKNGRERLVTAILVSLLFLMHSVRAEY